MANAIKHISVQRGYDVTEYTLCCFGGAGGQHACLVADALGMTRVFIHPLAGVLSAYGMGLADVRALRQQAVEAVLTEAALAAAAANVRGARSRRARRGRGAGHRRRAHHRASARCTSSTTAPTRRSRFRWRRTLPAIVAEFEKRYAQQYGFLMPGKPLVIEAVAVEAIGTHAVGGGRAAGVRAARGTARARCKTNRIYTEGAFREARVFDRDGPAAGRRDRRPRGDPRAQRARR